jgi:glutathione S-transferase
MSSIKIYGGRMGSSFRPHWMLAELGLDYETVSLDMRAGEHKQPAFLAINPAGQVPAMVYDGFALSESAAIIHYLSEKHDPSFLGATPEERASVLRWEFFALLNIDKSFATLASKTWGMPSSPEDEAKANEVLARFMPVLDSRLAVSKYLAGDTFTTADIVVRSSCNYGEAAGFDFTNFPKLQDWMTRTAARPAYAKAKQG